MPKLKVSEVKTTPRFRTRFVDIDKLAESIRTFGLIEPIVLDENNVLIAGERRLKAHKRLKMEEIEVKYIRDLNELEKKEIELEENIQRDAFTWQEEVSAKAALHKLKQTIHGGATPGHKGWGVVQTADALGESPGTVSMDIQLARGMKAFPELMKEKSKTTAYKKLKDKQREMLQTELAKRMKARKMLEHPSIIHGDCIAEMAKMDADSVDLIITDPPFGIELAKAQSFKKHHDKVYSIDDDNYTIFDMLDKAAAQMYRVLRMDRHAYVFCGIQYAMKLRDILMKYGFTVHNLPLIWDKGSGSYPSQQTTYVHSYEAFLHCIKGKRRLNGTPRDIFPIKRVPSNKKIHPTEKPTELLRSLIELSSLLGEKVLDPFAGSGATIVAAKETNRQGVGIEIDERYYTGIIERLGGK